ncbi:MAG: glycosyltransferase family A protein [Dokdonia sp.]|jgi:glycosyltransferase involved in cell wall biosynthesis|nr:glycosyl transferase family 2 [Cytophagaceae bacterium]|tara:strand:+ start:19 stop:870 length:852 start_codon:yes stop_codon:yes gene_type:complete
MRTYIVIPCHNEAAFIGQTLDSLLAQTHPAQEILVVDDQSTDASAQIVSAFAKAHPCIKLHQIQGTSTHQPGSKVVSAFLHGLAQLDDNYDLICKFDADLIFPKNYLELICKHFESHPKTGIAGGFCYIEKDGHWQLENLTNKDHIRGALKTYRKACFEAIGQLKPAMGWDTIDELLAQYHGWALYTDASLQVKHLKPTGQKYTAKAYQKQGKAFYQMRYGLRLTIIASIKLALRKNNLLLAFQYLKGYMKAKTSKTEYLVSQPEGQFIRQLRWRGIRSKLMG